MRKDDNNIYREQTLLSKMILTKQMQNQKKRQGLEDRNIHSFYEQMIDTTKQRPPQELQKIQNQALGVSSASNFISEHKRSRSLPHYHPHHKQLLQPHPCHERKNKMKFIRNDSDQLEKSSIQEFYSDYKHYEKNQPVVTNDNVCKIFSIPPLFSQNFEINDNYAKFTNLFEVEKQNSNQIMQMFPQFSETIGQTLRQKEQKFESERRVMEEKQKFYLQRREYFIQSSLRVSGLKATSENLKLGSSQVMDPLPLEEFAWQKEKRENVCYDKDQLNKDLDFNKYQHEKGHSYMKLNETNCYNDTFALVQKRKIQIRRQPVITVAQGKNYSQLAKRYPLTFMGNYQKTEFRISEPDVQNESIRKDSLTLEEEEQQHVMIKSLKVKQIMLQWQIIPQTRWKPEARESGTFVLYGRRGYLYGGIGQGILNSVNSADLSEFTWQKCVSCGEAPSQGRYGHTAVLYKRKMYIYGGVNQISTFQKDRFCINEIRSYQFDRGVWELQRVNLLGDILEPRRNHAAAVIGTKMIVHGGQNSANKYLNDLWHFDLEKKYWNLENVQGTDVYKKGVAFHQCEPVFFHERENIRLGRALPGEVSQVQLCQIKYEGLYFFGGKMKDQQFTNQLTILQIDRTPMKWLIPEVKGKQPQPRYMHQMKFFLEFGIIVVHGGKNDDMGDNAYFSDVCILKLHDLQWINVITAGIIKTPRAGHNITIYKQKLIVFGGYNQNGLLNLSLDVLSLDSTKKRRGTVFNPDKLDRVLRPNEIGIANQKKKTTFVFEGGEGDPDDLCRQDSAQDQIQSKQQINYSYNTPSAKKNNSLSKIKYEPFSAKINNNDEEERHVYQSARSAERKRTKHIKQYISFQPFPFFIVEKNKDKDDDEPTTRNFDNQQSIDINNIHQDGQHKHLSLHQRSSQKNIMNQKLKILQKLKTKDNSQQ